MSWFFLKKKKKYTSYHLWLGYKSYFQWMNNLPLNFQAFWMKPIKNQLWKEATSPTAKWIGSFWVLVWAGISHSDSCSSIKMHPILGKKTESKRAFLVFQAAERSHCAVKFLGLHKWSLTWILHITFETSKMTPVCSQSLFYIPAYNLSSAFDSSQHLCPFSRPPCMVLFTKAFRVLFLF